MGSRNPISQRCRPSTNYFGSYSLSVYLISALFTSDVAGISDLAITQSNKRSNIKLEIFVPFYAFLFDLTSSRGNGTIAPARPLWLYASGEISVCDPASIASENSFCPFRAFSLDMIFPRWNWGSGAAQ